MARRATYSLQILLGTIAALAVAAGAFAAPPSPLSGFLVLILATCGPGLLLVVWRSGGGYRRSFVIGAAAPTAIGAGDSLTAMVWTDYSVKYPTVTQIVESLAFMYRDRVMTFSAIALGGGLAGMGIHWLMKPRDECVDNCRRTTDN